VIRLTRHAITHRADADGVDALVAERDYVLAYIVSQLASIWVRSRYQRRARATATKGIS
jgi:hypothetical protein